ncbi:MAG TPA: hypothetical protein VJT50_07220 [Pyrinomonadaceae bacterium]|nr:hypothetical protein [Pyrinomonadaceae bacterium]
MKHKRTFRYGLNLALIVAVSFVGGLTVAFGQEEKPAEKPAAVKRGGRDPFKKYEILIKPPKTNSKLEAPSIQARIERYKAQKLAAAAAHITPPKPTTALLLNEMQVTGIFRTPRGWAAMVEATPIKLSYVVYPGESFFDGQLVAIEEGRLVFRRETVWTDGKRDKSIEIKALRQVSTVQAMTTASASPATPAPENVKPTVPDQQ